MSIERVVVNSSPLIALCRSGQEQILPRLFKTVVVPNQVYEEVVAGKNDEAAKVLRSQPEWMNREKVEISLAVAAWNLGEGESAVFSFAMKVPKHRAVVDDLAARRCAEVLGIKTLAIEKGSRVDTDWIENFRDLPKRPWTRFSDILAKILPILARRKYRECRFDT